MKKFHLQDVKPVYTSIITNNLISYKKQAISKEIYIYQQKMRFLIYVIIIIRADAARASGKFIKNLTNLLLIYQKAINRVLTYLYKTKILVIKYFTAAATDGQQAFLYANNAVFADDLFIRRNTKGYFFQLFKGLIDWRSIKQKIIIPASETSGFCL